MNVIAATLSIVFFLAALHLLNIVRIGSEVLKTVQGALAKMRDESLDDRAREAAARNASLRLMRAFVSILVRGGFAVLLSLAPIWLAEITGMAKAAEIVSLLSRWDVILLVTCLIVGGFAAKGRMWPFR